MYMKIKGANNDKRNKKGEFVVQSYLQDGLSIQLKPLAFTIS